MLYKEIKKHKCHELAVCFEDSTQTIGIKCVSCDKLLFTSRIIDEKVIQKTLSDVIGTGFDNTNIEKVLKDGDIHE